MRVRVNGVSGRWIEPHAVEKYKSEKEVLFPRDTRFEVREYRELSENEIEIDLDEVQ